MKAFGVQRLRKISYCFEAWWISSRAALNIGGYRIFGTSWRGGVGNLPRVTSGQNGLVLRIGRRRGIGVKKRGQSGG